MGSERTLKRPPFAWPGEASLIAHEFPGVLVEALNQGDLVAYLGWYADSPTEGSVWHRWGKGQEDLLGISLIAAIYSLWGSGLIEILAQFDQGRTSDIWLALGTGEAHQLAPLEREVLSRVRESGRITPALLVSHLALPGLSSRKRGIASWFFSGTSSQRKQGKEAWFLRTSKFAQDAPAGVEQALDLAKCLVALESATDLTGRNPVADEAEREMREAATYVIETAVFDGLKARS